MKTLADEVRAQVDTARSLYNRLVLVVGHAGSGKTAVLRALCERQGLPYVNLNLILSQRLLEHPSKARPLMLRGVLEEVLAKEGAEVVVLDNIEILFDPGLKQDPLRLLQLASRNRTIVASWNGDASGRTLSYAVAGHPEYRRYNDVDAILVRADRDKGAPEEDPE